MSKRIKFAIVSLVSLCKRGANRLPGLYKSDSADEVVFEAMAKMDEEGMLTSLVYLPDSEDSQGHQASQATIESMAHSFMENGAALDVNHNLKPLDKSRAYVAESFIVQQGDPRFNDAAGSDGKAVDATGAWCIKTQLVDPDLRKLYREDGWDGVSLYAAEGDYALEEIPIKKAATVAAKVAVRKQGKSDMDEEKLALALAKIMGTTMTAAMAPVLAIVTDLKKSAESGTPPKADDPKEFVVPSPSDRTAWRQYKKDLAKAETDALAEELRDSFDLTTLEGAKKYEAALKKASGEDEAGGSDKPVSYGNANPQDLLKTAMYSSDVGTSPAENEVINRVLAARGRLKKQYQEAS